MTSKIRWGIISTANIGVAKVIPGIQRSPNAEVVAISSRSIESAKAAATQLNIPRAYGSYEALLEDPDIDAVYNPLPNHLHVEWTLKAMKAGKHVLCEKPIGLNASEAELLLNETRNHPSLKVMEAFMYRFHPQWIKTKKLVEQGILGEVKTIHSSFTYYNDDANNIRNQADIGGGGLMDIGCYCISFPRFIYGAFPGRVSALIDYDPQLKTDRLTSGMLDFGAGKTATFTCSTQLFPYQRCTIFGTKGNLEIEIPVNAPPDRPTRLWVTTDQGKEEITFEITDQYTLQAQAFEHAIINNEPVPTSLEDALENMKLIDSLVQSAATHQWITP